MRKIDEIIFFGKLIEKYHLISSHGGNISIRLNDNILITKTGSMLGNLTPKDIVVVSLKNDNDNNIKKASMELVVHKAIYEASNANVVIHTHPEYTILLSLFNEEIIPVDSEGKFSIKKVPVIEAENTIASLEVAKKIKNYTNIFNAAVVKAHGLFVWSDSVEKAFYLTTSIEKSAKILYLHNQWIRKKN